MNAPTATRRQALAMGAAMVTVAALAWVGRPSRHVADARARRPLAELFPSHAGAWGTEAVTGGLVRPRDGHDKPYGLYDQVLERIYRHSDGRQVMLSVAYGAEQSVGLQVHRPEICYDGGGFRVSPTHRSTLRLADQQVPVTRLTAVMPGRPEPITYWVVLGDQVQSDPYAWRWRQLSLGLRGRVLDGMLVRVSSIDIDTEAAYRTHAEFADQLARAIPGELRVRVIGSTSGA